MTNTKQFMKDAVAGGWKPSDLYNGHNKTAPIIVLPALLDPLAWQAVGKTRGWMEMEQGDADGNIRNLSQWIHNWHRFIDYLANGLTIEEALGKISE